ncbi:hypothetical protein HK100_009111, partial [Physocladia obscura]
MQKGGFNLDSQDWDPIDPLSICPVKNGCESIIGVQQSGLQGNLVVLKRIDDG